MTKSVIYLFFATLVLTTLPAKSWDEFRGYDPGLWDMEFRTQYYKATGNYSHGGGEVNSLTSGTSYSLMNFDLGVRWTPSARWGFFGQTNIANSSSSDGLVNRNNSSLTNFKLGTDLLIFSGDRIEWVAVGSFLMPFKKIDTKEDTSANQEGTTEVDGRILGRMSIKNFVPFGSIGVTYRTDGRSTLVPYSLGTEYVMGSSAVGLGLAGFNSAFHYDDKSGSARGERELYNTAKNGGAYRFYAVNPNYLEAQLWYRYDGGGMLGFQLGYGTGVTGQDYAAGWNIFAGLNFRFKDDSPPSSGQSKEKRQITRPGKQDVEKFKEENSDGVDQQLFDPDNVNSASLKENKQEIKVELKTIRPKK